MKQPVAFKHEFVESLPELLKEHTVYVCMDFATVSHKCACGCGNEVVTPLSPTDWKLMYDGRAVTLHPSIGNWGFRCRSHYWIRGNRVEWAPSMSDEEIKAGRLHDRHNKDRYFDLLADTPQARESVVRPRVIAKPEPARQSTWKRFINWLVG